MKAHHHSDFSIAVAVAFWLALVTGAFAGPDDIRPLKAKTGLAPFTYTNAPEVMPNYVAGAR